MLQEIYPHRLDMSLSGREAEDGDYAIVLKGNQVLLAGDGTTARIPTVAQLRAAGLAQSPDFIRLFGVDDQGIYLYTHAPEAPSGFSYGSILNFRAYQPGWEAFAWVTACHLGSWYGTNRFCGSCGNPTERKADERAVQCTACGLIIYPRISPAVIVGITDGDAILLTRYANRPGATLSALIAGFMEIGETVEDTIRREVMEEVGLRVKNIRYYKSQPWAFSGSILLGFYADLDGSPELTVDNFELQEAAWVKRDDLPKNAPTFSLTATMVDTFRRGEHPIR